MPEVCPDSQTEVSKCDGLVVLNKNASPAAVREIIKFSTARMWVSAMLLTWITSHRLRPSPIVKGLILGNACMNGGY